MALADFEGVVDYSSETGATGSYDTSAFGHRTMGLLTDGTLLGLIRTSTTVLKVVYSTDGGETWTACATTLTVDSSQGFSFNMVVDEFDNIFVARYVNTGVKIDAITFSGSDITVQATANPAHSYREAAGMAAFDNPTISGNKTYIAHGGIVSTTARIYDVNYDRDTQTFDTPAFLKSGSASISSSNGNCALILMRTDPNDTRKMAAPSSPTGVWTFLNSASILYTTPITWDGVNHRLAFGTTTPTALAAPNVGRFDAMYDRLNDRYVYINPYSATTFGVHTHAEPVSGTATQQTDGATTSGGAGRADSASVAADGVNEPRHFSLHVSDAANQNFYHLDWVEGSTTFGTESVYSATESTEATSIGCVAWACTTPAGSVITYTWMEDATAQPRLYVRSQVGGGAFVGWGIPMGIA